MTGPRSVAALASLVLVCAGAACTNFYEIPIETPIQPKMDVTPFTRVLVAGFIGGGTDDTVDANLETVRLLRSQLRSKSTMRVIEAEALPLADIARDHVGKNPPGTPSASPTSGGQIAADPPPNGAQSVPAPVPSLPPTTGEAPQAPVTAAPATTAPADAAPATAAPPATTAPATTPAEADGKIRSEKDLERYQGIFSDAAFWKKLGQEHQSPLIVTGTVLFTNTQTAGFVTTNREVIDPLGRRVVQPLRVYMERKGFIIEPRFVFIDGRTGAVLYSDRFHEEILYPASNNVPALSSYFELMDRLIPSFLGSLSTQRIRGTRVLLK